MNRRMIDSSLWQNEHFAELPIEARLLLIGMINLADDQGRIKANPAWLRAQVYPYDNYTTDQIQTWLELIADNDTVILYTVDGKQFAQMVNWWKYQSLQYAVPSQYPRPEGWQDRIRKTITKGFIATCNWHTVDGAQLPNTCDQDGNPLPRVKQQSRNGSKPPDPERSHSADSPESTGDYSGESLPESTGEGTRVIKDQLNLREDQGRVDLYEYTAQPVADNATALPPIPEPSLGNIPPMERHESITPAKPKVKAVRHNSPHLKAERFADGYIPPGQGRNAVEVYYERFSLNHDPARLSAPLEDDLIRNCPDLPRLRTVVEAYSRCNYKPGNVQLILDWYAKGVPNYAGDKRIDGDRKPEYGILARGASDNQRAANRPTDDEIERVRAERRAAKAAGLSIQQWQQRQGLAPS